MCPHWLCMGMGLVVGSSENDSPSTRTMAIAVSPRITCIRLTYSPFVSSPMKHEP